MNDGSIPATTKERGSKPARARGMSRGSVKRPRDYPRSVCGDLPSRTTQPASAEPAETDRSDVCERASRNAPPIQ